MFLGTRFREGLDFGFVYLDIMHVYPEDAGTYTLKATNVLGRLSIPPIWMSGKQKSKFKYFPK